MRRNTAGFVRLDSRRTRQVSGVAVWYWPKSTGRSRSFLAAEAISGVTGCWHQTSDRLS